MSEIVVKQPLEPVRFVAGDEADVMRPVWQVTMNEDGSLTIMPIGRRPGRVLVMPSSHTSIVVTTDRLVAEQAGIDL